MPGCRHVAPGSRVPRPLGFAGFFPPLPGAALAAGLKGKACTNATGMGVPWQTVIHFAFILSAMGIAWTDKLMTGSASRREHVAH